MQKQMKEGGILSIVSFKRPKVMTQEMEERFLREMKEGNSTPDKDCPDLVANYEKQQKSKRKLIVAGDDSGSN